MSHASTLPESVRDFLRAAGVHLREDADGKGFDFGDSETSNVVRLEGDEYVVRKVSRGVIERVVLRTVDEGTLWRFVIVAHISSFRARTGLPVLPAPADRPPPPREVVIRRDAPGRSTLSWSKGGKTHHASEVTSMIDERLTRAVVCSLDDLIAAVGRADGAPVFGPPRP